MYGSWQLLAVHRRRSINVNVNSINKSFEIPPETNLRLNATQPEHFATIAKRNKCASSQMYTIDCMLCVYAIDDMDMGYIFEMIVVAVYIILAILRRT